MTATHIAIPDPKLDLVLTRIVEVPPELVWRAWTVPEELMPWFCPRPWQTVACEIDLRPGGCFNTTMRSPEGVDHPNVGCFLEVVPHRRLVFTDALRAGYRPAAAPFMTAVITIEPAGAGTRYTAMALHHDEATCRKHEEMGFSQGWGTALDQMVEHIRAGM